MAVMNRMRENTKNILLILVFAFIATIIFDWGMGGFQGPRGRNVIAKVEGQEIPYDEFYQNYQNELRAYRERTGADPEGYQLQQIENQVFESLVQQRLLGEIVSDMDLEASDGEIVDEIYNHPPEFLKTQPAFLDSNGVFQMEAYQRALSDPQTNWAPIENYLRVTLPLNKLQYMFNATALVTDDEAFLEYKRRNAKAKVDYVLYSLTQFAQDVSEPTEAEIQAYYNENREDYKQAERRQFDYVLLETTPTAADTQAIFNQADELLQDIEQGDSFQELASVYSEDPGSAEKGGDLGWFGSGQMVEPFEKAAFNAEPGDIVGPVETSYGIHIIKVEDKRVQDGEQQVKARHILLKFDASPQTREALREEAEYISTQAMENDLKSVAEAENVELQTTPPFELDAFIQGIGMESRVNRFAFRSDVGTVSPVFQTERGFVVAEVSNIIKEGIRPLDEVENQIISALKQEKQKELVAEKARAAYQKIQSGAFFDKVADQDSVEIKSTDFFTMSPYIPNVGNAPEFVGTAFSLDIGDFSEPIPGAQGYYILQVTDKQEVSRETFEAQKETLKRQMLQRKKQAVFGQWYTNYKEEASVEDYRVEFL
ncbi:hypothetical protein GF406_21975 [candidate division KSB1 bacterium]|nr:hypothetical protein [candidate division KSB1 bacterium]